MDIRELEQIGIPVFRIAENSFKIGENVYTQEEISAGQIQAADLMYYEECCTEEESDCLESEDESFIFEEEED